MIEVENLSKTYVDEPVVRDLSFFVPEGQVLGFLGPNGAGKTTVMRMLTAFLPPTTGRVVVAGIDLDKDSVALRRNVGYLPENVPLYPEMRVDEFLRFRAEVEEVPRMEVRQRMDEVVERCLIGEVRRQVIGTLSKGFRQRVGLAGALIHQPPVLILDEPTVGLDPNQIIKVRELITELGQDHTVLLSTHILPEVEQVCLKGANGAGRQALESLPGVSAVTEQAAGCFLLEHPADADPREAVFKLAVDRGWVLLALTPQRATLEDVFVRLTTREEATPATPVAEEV
jgi:ABC-2 type transport system ATP-binding protein